MSREDSGSVKAQEGTISKNDKALSNIACMFAHHRRLANVEL